MHVALESLITSLRTHLTRLTDELEQHKEMLAQIRIDNQTKENKWEERWQEFFDWFESDAVIKVKDGDGD